MSEQSEHPSTRQLWAQLFQSESVDVFFTLNSDISELPCFSDYITILCQNRNEKPERVIKRTNMERSYGHRLFSGTRQPSRGTYPQGTSDPKETNVVVAYRESVQKDGVWVDKSTGKNVGAGLKQKVSLYVIRLDDWSLITQADFSVQLDYGENGTNVLHMNQVESYLNNLFEE